MTSRTVEGRGNGYGSLGILYAVLVTIGDNDDRCSFTQLAEGVPHEVLEDESPIMCNQSTKSIQSVSGIVVRGCLEGTS
jgi:hypothetical protein